MTKGVIKAGSNKRKAGPKVSKQLRLKIQKVLEPTMVQGKFTEVGYYQHVLPADNRQDLQNIWNAVSYQTATESAGGGLFTPYDLINAASVMWNGATNVTALRNVSGLGFFNFQGLRLYVKNSYAQITLVNNTQVTKIVKIHNFAPKQLTTDGALKSIQAALTTMAAGYTQTGGGTVGVISNWNGLSTALHMNPSDILGWKKVFSDDVMEVRLEPGQTYVFNIAGPANTEIKFEKLMQNGTLGLARFTRFPVMQFYNEMQCTDTNVVGRFVSGTVGYGILSETKVVYELCMPEQAGFKYPTSLAAPVPGAPQPLSERTRKSYYFNYATTKSGNVTRVDDQQPATIETNPGTH